MGGPVGIINVSREQIVGLVTMSGDTNAIIACDSQGLVKQIDLRNSSTTFSTNISEGINCAAIILPGCLIVGTDRNLQVESTKV